MSWSTIAESDVLQELNSQEQAVLTKINNATDNLPSILARAVNAARASIIAGGNQLDQPDTIPDQLRSEVISIARWRWLLSLPAAADELQSKNRKADYDDAKATLKDVSLGKIKVEVPATPVTQQAPSNAIQVASKTRRVATQRKMGGLV